MSTLRRTLSTIAAIAAVVPAVASAQFANPGFETPATPNGGYQIFSGGSSFGGWDVVGTQVLLLNTNYVEPYGVGGATLSFNAHGGMNALDLTGAGNNGTSAGVQQSILTAPGQAYSVSFWVGKATGVPQYYGTPSTVDVSIDGGPRMSYTNSMNVPNMVAWQQFTQTFTATGSNTLVTFYNGTTDNNMVGLDDVGVSTVTPEPATLALLGAPLLAIGMVRRRRAR